MDRELTKSLPKEASRVDINIDVYNFMCFYSFSFYYAYVGKAARSIK